MASITPYAEKALERAIRQNLKSPSVYFAMLPPIPLVLDIEIICFTDNPESGQSSALLGIHLPNEFRLAIVPVLQPQQTNDSAWESAD